MVRLAASSIDDESRAASSKSSYLTSGSICFSCVDQVTFEGPAKSSDNVTTSLEQISLLVARLEVLAMDKRSSAQLTFAAALKVLLTMLC